MLSQRRNITVVLLCGVPGVGKTTLCKKFCSCFIPDIFCSTAREFYGHENSEKEVDYAICHIEYDLVYHQLSRSTTNRGEFDSSVWKETYHVVEEALKRLVSGVSGKVSEAHLIRKVEKKKEGGWSLETAVTHPVGTLVFPVYTNCLDNSDHLPTDRVHWFILLDDNFMYDSMRRTIFNLCRVYGVHFVILHMLSSPTTCLQRLSLRDDSPPLPVVKRTMDRFDSPTKMGSMGKHLVTLNESYALENGSLSWHDFFYSILSDSFVTFPPCETSQVSSEKHQFDLLLRKAVSNILCRHPHTTTTQGLWKTLCKNRKQLLKDYERKWKHIVPHSTIAYWETMVLDSSSN